jgi:hypothetical protein
MGLANCQQGFALLLLLVVVSDSLLIEFKFQTQFAAEYTKDCTLNPITLITRQPNHKAQVVKSWYLTYDIEFSIISDSLDLVDANYTLMVQNQDEDEVCSANWTVTDVHNNRTLAESPSRYWHFQALEFAVINQTVQRMRYLTDDKAFRVKSVWTQSLTVSVLKSAGQDTRSMLVFEDMPDGADLFQISDGSSAVLQLPFGYFELYIQRNESLESPGLLPEVYFFYDGRLIFSHNQSWGDQIHFYIAVFVDQSFNSSIGIAHARDVYPDQSPSPSPPISTDPPTAPSFERKDSSEHDTPSTFKSVVVYLICIVGAALIGVGLAAVIVYRTRSTNQSAQRRRLLASV